MTENESLSRFTALGGGRSIWDAYAAELDASDKTRTTYTRALKKFAAWLDVEGVAPLEATRETITAYKRYLRANKSAATVNCYLTAVRSLYQWLEARRIYPNVAAGIKGERTSAHSAKEALTKEQAQRLIAPSGDSLAAKRDGAMLNLMLRRGLRTCEVARANIEDIRQEGGKAVLYVQGKGKADKGEFVVLGEECLTPIYAYLEARGEADPKAPLFAAVGNRNGGGRMTTRSISRIAKAHMAERGMSSARLTAHSLRHTAVTFALMGGATVQEAQAMARHASIGTTMIYAHNLDRLNAGGERGVDTFLSA